MQDLKQRFRETFNRKSDMLQSVVLSKAQEEQLDLLEDLLEELSSEDMELGIEICDLSMAVGLRTQNSLAYVPFTVGNDELTQGAFIKLDLSETECDSGENRFGLKEDRELFADVLARELSARAERFIQVKEVADYLSRKP